ncbi:MAG: hypothetical protein ACE5OR_09940 [bacterium]
MTRRTPITHLTETALRGLETLKSEKLLQTEKESLIGLEYWSVGVVDRVGI